MKGTLVEGSLFKQVKLSDYAGKWSVLCVATRPVRDVINQFDASFRVVLFFYPMCVYILFIITTGSNELTRVIAAGTTPSCKWNASSVNVWATMWHLAHYFTTTGFSCDL